MRNASLVCECVFFSVLWLGSSFSSSFFFLLCTFPSSVIPSWCLYVCLFFFPSPIKQIRNKNSFNGFFFFFTFHFATKRFIFLISSLCAPFRVIFFHLHLHLFACYHFFFLRISLTFFSSEFARFARSCFFFNSLFPFHLLFSMPWRAERMCFFLFSFALCVLILFFKPRIDKNEEENFVMAKGGWQNVSKLGYLHTLSDLFFALYLIRVYTTKCMYGSLCVYCMCVEFFEKNHFPSPA